MVWQPSARFERRLLDTAVRLKVIGRALFDLQIAMVAVEHGARIIYTHDKNFIRLEGLQVTDPLKLG